MSNRFYKTRKNRLVAGVVAGLADYKEDIYPEIKLKDGRKRKNAEPVEDEWNW